MANGISMMARRQATNKNNANEVATLPLLHKENNDDDPSSIAPERCRWSTPTLRELNQEEFSMYSPQSERDRWVAKASRINTETMRATEISKLHTGREKMQLQGHGESIYAWSVGAYQGIGTRDPAMEVVTGNRYGLLVLVILLYMFVFYGLIASVAYSIFGLRNESLYLSTWVVTPFFTLFFFHAWSRFVVPPNGLMNENELSQLNNDNGKEERARDRYA